MIIWYLFPFLGIVFGFDYLHVGDDVAESHTITKVDIRQEEID